MPDQKILVTGGAGFIGSEFVRQQAKKSQLIVVDKLTYAGDLKRLEEVKGRFKFYKVDIADASKLKSIFAKEKPTSVVHFAAESHVDRSILDASPFIQTNVVGTQILLDLSRASKIQKFLHVSTDEVYGDILKGQFNEESPIKPNSPYAASKAAADLLVKSYIRTYKFPATIIRACNNYGPWQYPEKFVPVAILKAMHNQPIPVYGQGKQIREWLHVSDCADAIAVVLRKGLIGEVYNIGSGFEQNNLKTAQMILKILGKPQSLIQFVQDRPGHDFRYSLVFNKLKRLGWIQKINLRDGMISTVEWNLKNAFWVKAKIHRN